MIVLGFGIVRFSIKLTLELFHGAPEILSLYLLREVRGLTIECVQKALSLDFHFHI